MTAVIQARGLGKRNRNRNRWALAVLTPAAVRTGPRGAVTRAFR